MITIDKSILTDKKRIIPYIKEDLVNTLRGISNKIQDIIDADNTLGGDFESVFKSIEFYIKSFATRPANPALSDITVTKLNTYIADFKAATTLDDKLHALLSLQSTLLTPKVLERDINKEAVISSIIYYNESFLDKLKDLVADTTAWTTVPTLADFVTAINGKFGEIIVDVSGTELNTWYDFHNSIFNKKFIEKGMKEVLTTLGCTYDLDTTVSTITTNLPTETLMGRVVEELMIDPTVQASYNLDMADWIFDFKQISLALYDEKVNIGVKELTDKLEEALKKRGLEAEEHIKEALGMYLQMAQEVQRAGLQAAMDLSDRRPDYIRKMAEARSAMYKVLKDKAAVTTEINKGESIARATDSQDIIKGVSFATSALVGNLTNGLAPSQYQLDMNYFGSRYLVLRGAGMNPDPKDFLNIGKP